MSRTLLQCVLAPIPALALLIGCSDVSRSPLDPGENLTDDAVERALSDVPIKTEFIAVLDGSQVVPPVNTAGRGAAFFSVTRQYDDAGVVTLLEMRFYMIAVRVGTVTGVHIHLGGHGANGPVVANLMLTDRAPTYEEFTLEGTLTDEDIVERPELGFDGTVAALVRWMQRGDAYVDLHTVYYAGGEIRGQIYPFVIPPPPPPPPPIFYATLSGANVVPPVKTEARGRVRFELSSAGSGLYFKLEATRIERVTAAHIHLGVEGANGPIVAVLLGLPVNRPDPLTPSGPGIDWAPGIVVQGTLTDDDILPQPDLGFDGSLAALVSWMRRGAAYVVVRTVAHPTGEIRGQIRPEPQTCPDRDCETGG